MATHSYDYVRKTLLSGALSNPNDGVPNLPASITANPAFINKQFLCQFSQMIATICFTTDPALSPAEQTTLTAIYDAWDPNSI